MTRRSTEMNEEENPMRWITLVLAAVAVLGLAGCSGDGQDAARSESEPTSTVVNEPDADTDTDTDTDGPTGDGGGTVQIGDAEYSLSMVGTIAPSCRILEAGGSSVNGMGSGPSAGVGVSVTYGGSDDINWRASVGDHDSDGPMWEVAHDPTPGQDVTHQVSDGHVVIEGVWGTYRGGATETIRLEVHCPTS